MRLALAPPASARARLVLDAPLLDAPLLETLPFETPPLEVLFAALADLRRRDEDGVADDSADASVEASTASAAFFRSTSAEPFAFLGLLFFAILAFLPRDVAWVTAALRAGAFLAADLSAFVADGVLRFALLRVAGFLESALRVGAFLAAVLALVLFDAAAPVLAAPFLDGPFFDGPFFDAPVALPPRRAVFFTLLCAVAAGFGTRPFP